jgi:hypothetical protein
MEGLPDNDSFDIVAKFQNLNFPEFSLENSHCAGLAAMARWWLLCAAAAALLPSDADANSTEYWLGRRAAMVRAIFNTSTLPTRDQP